MKYNYNSTWNQLYLPPVGDTFPVGAVVDYSGATAPHNWLICDGSAVSRTTYSALFSVIGTTYGTGDGSTTFNLPNFTGKVGVGYASGDTDFGTLGKTGGEKTHYLTGQELTHTHRLWVDSVASGSSYGLIQGSMYWDKADNNWANGQFVPTDAQNASRVSHNNIQPYIVQNKIIKAYNVSASPVIVGSIINSLTSTSTTDALSANQGYVLNNSLNNLKPFLLFYNGSGTTGTVTLSDSFSNYRYIEIYFKSNDDSIDSVKCPNNFTRFNLFTANYYNTVIFEQVETISISGTTITRGSQKQISFTSSAVTSLVDTSIFIVKVVGYI